MEYAAAAATVVVVDPPNSRKKFISFIIVLKIIGDAYRQKLCKSECGRVAGVVRRDATRFNATGGYNLNDKECDQNTFLNALPNTHFWRGELC